MKKLLFALMIVLMAVALSAVYGNAEEADAVNEIAAHMLDEAAIDGVDLQKMLDAEALAYEERRQEKQQSIQNHNDFAALMQEEVKKPIGAFEAYTNASAPEDILAYAMAYNNAYDEYLCLAGGDPVKESSLLSYLERMSPIYKRTKIADSIYELKAAYAAFDGKSRFNEAWFYYNTEENTAHIVFQGIDEATYRVDELLVLNRSGSVCEIDLSTVTTETTSLIQSLGFIGDTYYLFTVDNADFKYWEFDVNGETAKGVPTLNSTVTSNEHWFMNTPEELNMGEPR